MYTELTTALQGNTLAQWQALLRQEGLVPEDMPQATVLVWEDDELIATGSRQGNLLKYIAVDSAHQGQDLTSTVLTNLRQDAFNQGYSHLFLYTKPENEWLFTSLFFYPIVKTRQVLLMESRKDGIREFLQSLPAENTNGNVGSLVMNCDPFTKGHQHLVQTAAKECDWVYVFVLSEDKGRFSAEDRLEMVKQGTAHLPNVTVLPTGPYLISSATFPTYFLKEREKAAQIHCQLDISVFCQYFVPKFSITHRYVGTEPLSPMTNQYNAALQQYLPENGITVQQIPRLEQGGTPVSASAVRALAEQGNWETIHALVPQTTYDYLQTHGLCK